ncbi:MAG: hypothetical protein ACLTSX_06515 [Collinsella sp.]
MLRHGFGPAVDFELPGDWGATAGISSGAVVSAAEIATPADPARACMRAMGGRGARLAYSPASMTPRYSADDLDQAMRWSQQSSAAVGAIVLILIGVQAFLGCSCPVRAFARRALVPEVAKTAR